jgi:hypothetical protein
MPIRSLFFVRTKSLRLITPSQVCLVTGAARGLGNEFCRAFIQSLVDALHPEDNALHFLSLADALPWQLWI